MSDSVVDKMQCPECAKTGGDTSEDNLAIYEDGHGHCFACGFHQNAGNEDGPRPSAKAKGSKGLLEGDYRALRSRSISEDTCRFFGYMVGSDRGKTVQIANYITDGRIVGQKVRTKDKKFRTTGDFKNVGLFGQHKFRNGGKRLVITEGEIDALTISQLQGNKWPVVSVSNGAQGAAKSIARQLEWVERFESVVFAFDMDEPGRQAAEECAALLSPGRAYIAHLPGKDANDCLLEGKKAELLDCLWGAKAWRPDGLVSIDDLIEEAERPIERGLPWCFPTLTEATYGRRFGEVYALGAGTGIGKTDVFTQQIAFDVTELGLSVGVVYLEQKPVETAKRVAGKVAGKRFHVPDTGWTVEEQRAALASLRGKVTFYDNFGETDWDVVKSKVRYMAVSQGIQVFYVDHLTALADTSNERESIEQTMKEMAGLANELGLIIHFVSHLATPDGKPHEEGGRVMIRHFKGSRTIGFWSSFVFGLERDQQNKDEELQKLTVFRVLKDRYTGQSTGLTFGLTYDIETGILSECELPTHADSVGKSFKNETGDY